MTNREKLGPAERLMESLLAYTDHMVHNRPGVIVQDTASPVGVRWAPATWVEEAGEKIVYALGKGRARERLGPLRDEGRIDGSPARFRPAGLFPEVAAWMYAQVAEVWKLDNELAARWASHAFGEDHRDLKVVLAAFLLVQTRKGEAVWDAGALAFHDADYREVGEAMMLLHRADGRGLHPKLLLRIHEVLTLPAVAELNRALGFAQSGRRPFLGRWTRAAEKWLRHREQNPKLLEALVRAGFRTTVMELARRVGFKPEGPRFFQVLRWKQKQAEDGRRTLALGLDVAPAESWEGMTELAICERIVREKPSFKRLVGLVPPDLGLTRAIVAAAIEAGSLSDKDLVIHTPTLEELGLLEVEPIRARWERALRASEDMRAANLAARVKGEATRTRLEETADRALQKATEAAAKDLRVYVFVDASGSMEASIATAKQHLARFLQGFPLERLHVAVFNTVGREVRIPHASAAGVENAFRGLGAGGGTDYGAGVRALQGQKPLPDEDVLFLFVGDEEAPTFANAVRASGLAPVAFGFVKVGGNDRERAVVDTAAELGIPCFRVDERTFADTYAVPRTLRALVAATPVARRAAREGLLDAILATQLLEPPPWAARA